MTAYEAGAGSSMASAAARALAAGGEEPVALGGYFSGARLLVSDTRVAVLLLREARHRACARLFGVSAGDSGIVTLIALATLAGAVHNKVHDVIAAAQPPTSSDAILGTGVLKETMHLIAGDWSRETPGVPTIIVAAVIGHHLRPWVRVSLRGVRTGSHVIRKDFDRRYGHLIRPNRRPPGYGADPREQRQSG